MDMTLANIKVPSAMLERLKQYTGEQTGQKAVQKALGYFLAEARQRRITDVLDRVEFVEGFDPLTLRSHER